MNTDIERRPSDDVSPVGVICRRHDVGPRPFTGRKLFWWHDPCKLAPWDDDIDLFSVDGDTCLAHCSEMDTPAEAARRAHALHDDLGGRTVPRAVIAQNKAAPIIVGVPEEVPFYESSETAIQAQAHL